MKMHYFFLILLIGSLWAQEAETHYLRVTPFESPKDSLALLMELRFWQEFREQAERSQAVQIAAGWDDIVTLLEYAEETALTPAIFDTSTIAPPAMIVPGYHLKGSIRYRSKQALEMDITILNVRTGVQTAAEHGRIPIAGDPFKDESGPALRRLIRKLLEPLDPRLQKERAWLGEPFDPELHEAISMQPSDTAEPGSVLVVAQKGYALNGRLLRPAMVVVAAEAPDEQESA